MSDSETIKRAVREKYAQIVTRSNSGCGCGCASAEDTLDYSVMSDAYDDLKGYVPEADLKLGCGLPTEHAAIKAGHTVLDLGSGAGNDVFVARQLVGESGRVIGVDFTPEMVAKARQNAKRLGFQNVTFEEAEIEDLPLENTSTDVVISNCVLNLVPDKNTAFGQIFRVLKPGGHFCISDIVLQGELPADLQKEAAVYAGCVAGAMQEQDYLQVIRDQGFSEPQIKTRKRIELPDELLQRYLSPQQVNTFKNNGPGIFSITVVAKRP